MPFEVDYFFSQSHKNLSKKKKNYNGECGRAVFLI